MVVRIAATLLAAILLAGCQASPTLERLRGADVDPEPVYLERRAEVNATHDARWPIEVGERAASLNVTLRLDTRSPALSTLAPPARLSVEVLAPSGRVLAVGTLDPAHAEFEFFTDELAERGVHVVHVSGQGVSETLRGEGYGASYVLVMEVLQG